MAGDRHPIRDRIGKAIDFPIADGGHRGLKLSIPSTWNPRCVTHSVRDLPGYFSIAAEAAMAAESFRMW